MELSPVDPRVGDICRNGPKSRGCRALYGPGVDPNLRLSPKGPRKPTRRTGGLLPDRRDGGRKGGSGTRSRISREARPPAAAPSNTEVPSGLLVPGIARGSCQAASAFASAKLRQGLGLRRGRPLSPARSVAAWLAWHAAPPAVRLSWFWSGGRFPQLNAEAFRCSAWRRSLGRIWAISRSDERCRVPSGPKRRLVAVRRNGKLIN